MDSNGFEFETRYKGCVIVVYEFKKYKNYDD
jgi:hypothetical protein